MTIPNILTLVRIALIPVFAILFCLPTEWSGYAAATVFGIACVTDWLDGYLARKLNQMSDFGAFLDPVADKLAVSVALVLLAYNDSSMLILTAAVIIISREILVSALREWMAIKGISEVVKVSFIGKLKTAFQMSAIFIMFMSSYADWVKTLGITLLLIATALSIKSMLNYFVQAADRINLDEVLNVKADTQSKDDATKTKQSVDENSCKLFTETDREALHVALASLLYHIISIGHESSDKERHEFTQILKDEFSLSDTQVKSLYVKVESLNWSINNDLDTINLYLKKNPIIRMMFMNKLNHLVDIDGVTPGELDIFFSAQKRLFPDVES